MKICDKCGGEVYGAAEFDSQVFDLCRVHCEELRQWFMAPDVKDDPVATKPRRGRPRKTLDTGQLIS